MTDPFDDEVERRLRQPIEPLAPPPGTFERITRTARRRRRARAGLAAAFVAVFALGIGTGLGLNGGPLVLLQRVRTASDDSPSPRSAPAASTRAREPSRSSTHPGGQGQPEVPGPRSGPVPPHFRPTSVTFVSTSLGWAIGQGGPPCATRYCTSVVRTVDGGRHWAGIPAPRTSGVSQIRFADALDGFAFGPQLWVTHDGGKTWRQLDTHGAAVTALEAAGRHVFAVFEDCAAGSDCTYELHATPAGSDAWQPVPDVGQTADGAVSVAAHGSRAYLAAADKGRAVLYSGPSSGSGTWEARPAPCTNGPTQAQVATTTARKLLVVCDGESSVGAEVKQAYASPDGGRHWRRLTDPPATGQLRAVSSTPDGTYYIARVPGGVLVSRDGGGSWTESLGERAGDGYRYVGFTTDTQGFAVPGADGNRVVELTRDNGRTWSPVTFR